jgi:transcriptional regulator with XRE-family HTH domain
MSRKPSALGALIKNRRRELGITQKQLSEMTGTKVVSISRLENGHQDDMLYTSICKIFDALNIDKLYLSNITREAFAENESLRNDQVRLWKIRKRMQTLESMMRERLIDMDNNFFAKRSRAKRSLKQKIELLKYLRSGLWQK